MWHWLRVKQAMAKKYVLGFGKLGRSVMLWLNILQTLPWDNCQSKPSVPELTTLGKTS